jgi:PAS domain S-box-containing protein
MRIRARSIIIFLIAFLTLAGFTWFVIRDNQNSIKTNYWINHSHEAIRDIGNYYSTCMALESQTQGYWITGRRIDAGEHEKEADSLRDQLVALQTLTRDNPDQQKNFRILSNLTNELISYTESPPGLKKSFRQVTAQLGQAVRERQLMEKIYDQCNVIRQEEGRLLVIRIAQNRKVNSQLVKIAIIGSILSFIFLLAGVLQLNRDINRREKAEQEARISETKYRSLIEDSGVVMFTTALSGNFTFLSNKVYALTGYSKQELLGQHYSRLVAPDWLEKVSLSFREQLRTRTHESLMEFPIVTKNGERKWVEQMAFILNEGEKLTGFQCIVKDISEKKSIELELKESEFKRKENQYRLQAIMDNTTSLVFIKDLGGRYLLVNKKFQEILNITDEYIYGKTDFEFSTRQAAEQYKKVDEMVIGTLQPQEVVEDLELQDGTHYFLITKFPLLDNNHRIFGICGIATDISPRKKYEEQLIQAKRIAEDAEKLQEQFLANMSHEIRTPLNGIIGMTNLISGTELYGDQVAFVNTIRESSNNLLVIINDILDFSKIKAGKLTIEQIIFNPEEVLHRTVNTFRHKIEEKNLTLEYSFDPNIPRSLTGDPYRLNQVLVNLIANAVKFTDEGTLRVAATLQKFTMDLVYVEFEVKDSGIGIPEDKWATIFESFAQGSSDTTRKYGGTGLGLAITKKLIDLQDGEIEMQSTVGQGTTFRFSIPFPFTNENVEDAEPKTDDVYQREMKGLNILVVEDNVINQKVVFYTMQRVGAHVEIAGNGEEALEKLKEGKSFDVVLMDIQMPELDGYETTRQIRGYLNLEMPIIAMTATVLRGEKEKCMEAGMNDYISKPFAPTDLFRKIALQLSGNSGTVEPVNIRSDQPAADYNLSYLTELGDPQQVREILETFLQMTPLLLEEIQSAVRESNWEKVFQKSHRLKTSLGMLQMTSIFHKIDTIEAYSRSRKRLEDIPALIGECVAWYDHIKGSLEEEKNKVTQELLPG